MARRSRHPLPAALLALAGRGHADQLTLVDGDRQSGSVADKRGASPGFESRHAGARQEAHGLAVFGYAWLSLASTPEDVPWPAPSAGASAT